MSRPSLTASIGPSPVLGFMAAIEFPFRDVSPYYRASAVFEKSRSHASTLGVDHGGVQSYPSTAQQAEIQTI
jgi:hypothetical protein